MTDNAEKIDFVIFWVDGQDPVHQAKKHRYLKDFKLESDKNKEQSTDDRRFVQFNELKYCLRSIVTHATWYNRIYLVTDQQVPTFLDPQLLATDRIEIIDHTELFAGASQYLPTFNSRSIATQLMYLDKLSDCYLVGNDDVMMSSAVEPDFFFKDGKPVIYADKHITQSWPVNSLYDQGIYQAAQMIRKSTEFYRPSHGFLPFDKPRLRQLQQRFPAEFSNNLVHRFRHESQFLIESLYMHDVIEQQQCQLFDTELMVHFSVQLCREGHPDKIAFLFDLLQRGERKMFCLNEYQSLIARMPEVDDWLNRLCGDPLKAEIY